MTIFVLRFCVCWTAEFPELKNGKNGQNVIESASITKYAYNAYLGTLQYSKKIDPARLYKMISNLICVARHSEASTTSEKCLGPPGTPLVF